MEIIDNLVCNTIRFRDIGTDTILERIDSRNINLVIPRKKEIVWLDGDDHNAYPYVVRSIEHNYSSFGADIIDINVEPQEI